MEKSGQELQNITRSTNNETAQNPIVSGDIQATSNYTGKQKRSLVALTVGILFLFALPIWIWFIAPQLTKLPNDFSYIANIFSLDNFYDEQKGQFSSESRSVTKFSYEITNQKEGILTVKNIFDVRTVAGEPIFAVERLYGIDPKTGRHTTEFGDKNRDGYLFAPKGLKKGEPFTYWHINYDGPSHMVFAEEENLFGLPVYRYETRYEDVRIDQTTNLGSLPGVGVTRGVVLEPYLKLWIEPVSGHLIKYTDDTIAYYYDLKTGQRLNPWNHFGNTYTRDSVLKQVAIAKSEKLRLILVEIVVPSLLALIALILLLFQYRKKIAIIAFVLGIVGLSAFAFNRFYTNSQAQPGGDITIGALVPITGQLAILGENIRNGMEIAKQDLVEAGVITKLDIIYEDACDETSSLNAVKKLIDTNKVKIIGSSFCLSGIDAISPITEANKVILFNTAANPESVLNKKYVFSTNITIREDSKKMADYAFHSLGAKTAALIQDDSSFGESYRNNFTKSFEALGGRVLSSSATSQEESDFQTELTKIKTENPDLLLIIHFGNSLGYAVKQTRDLGIESLIMGDYESEDPTLIQVAREATEGMIISSSQAKIKTENVTDFEKKYQEQFGELPDVLASNAYDSIKLQVTTFVACKGDTDCMARELEKVKNYDGVSGTITINQDHSVEKLTIFKIIKAGKFVEIQ